jgi:predicted adenine nucleotide alpha hydrolase (AANH) superfamily ATPase
VLLHICCGPCAIYPFANLTKAGFIVEGFFYNPNIQPDSEYSQRREAVEKFKDEFGVKVHFGEYDEHVYLERVQAAKDKTSRCRECFNLRLERTFLFALNNEFDLFTTTLLVSPYQDQQEIKSIAQKVSQGSQTQFLFCDFRPGFREAHAKARELNLYCQKYCGCLKSLEERSVQKKARVDKC